jgi:hypothetical protein
MFCVSILAFSLFVVIWIISYQKSYKRRCFAVRQFDVPAEKVGQIKPNRPSKPPPPVVEHAQTTGSEPAVKGEDNVPGTSA